MNLNQNEQSLLATVQQARTQRSTAMSQGGDRAVDPAGAYRIQALLSAGQPLVGYKLGLLSPAKQQQMGLSSPIYGRIFGAMLREGPVSLGDFIQPRVEPELAVVLRRPIGPGATAGAAMAALGGVFLGLDILDSIWQGYRFSAAEVIADNASGGGFVLGGRLTESVPSGTLRLYLNGTLRGEGPIEALGDTGERLAWLAAQVGGLAAGQIIFLGSPAVATPAEAGTLEVVGPDGLLLTMKLH
ncbi:MAG: fumarylacetoacetate hydrolase family protein [Chloroflexaceae bacterium]|jgi:2-keto-4-pentenoate hydratase|nr:fumarylacetoacetate hydrolase family protein [Chloroflexaceae bacterium]